MPLAGKLAEICPMIANRYIALRYFKVHFSFFNVFLLYYSYCVFMGSSNSKESACNVGDLGFNPWVRKIPWRRKWQPTPVCLPGESHGQRSVAGYSP